MRNEEIKFIKELKDIKIIIERINNSTDKKTSKFRLEDNFWIYLPIIGDKTIIHDVKRYCA